MKPAPGLADTIDAVVRQDRGRLMAALIAALNDFDLAEESLSDALESALIHWHRNGLPDSPQGWLLKVARRKAIDRLRRSARFRDKTPEIARLAAADEMDANQTKPDIPDERLRLIFTCCHPALDAKSRVALTLRTIAGLRTDEIARAFLDEPTTMGQRLTRAKAKIAKSGIPFAIPDPDMWQSRLDSVLAVIYLIFNEGFSASSGDSPIRGDLCDEAIYLIQLLDRLVSGEPEVEGLASLMLTTHARHKGRTDGSGKSVSMGDQDRTKWDGVMIKNGVTILERAVRRLRPGPYQIKAAISALHAQAMHDSDTDWPQILLLYDRLHQFEPTPVVQLNRAVALGETGRHAQALAEFERLATVLQGYQPYYAAHAEFLTRSGDIGAARVALDTAISLAGNAADRQNLQARKNRLLQ